jgi:hypothetical protein
MLPARRVRDPAGAQWTVEELGPRGGEPILLQGASHVYDRMRGPADAQLVSDVSYSGRRTGIPRYYYNRP